MGRSSQDFREELGYRSVLGSGSGDDYSMVSSQQNNELIPISSFSRLDMPVANHLPRWLAEKVESRHLPLIIDKVFLQLFKQWEMIGGPGAQTTRYFAHGAPGRPRIVPLDHSSVSLIAP